MRQRSSSASASRPRAVTAESGSCGSRGSGTRRRRWSIARLRAMVSTHGQQAGAARVVVARAPPDLGEDLLLDVLGGGAVAEHAHAGGRTSRPRRPRRRRPARRRRRRAGGRPGAARRGRAAAALAPAAGAEAGARQRERVDWHLVHHLRLRRRSVVAQSDSTEAAPALGGHGHVHSHAHPPPGGRRRPRGARRRRARRRRHGQARRRLDHPRNSTPARPRP